jgi:hypothetical protein
MDKAADLNLQIQTDSLRYQITESFTADKDTCIIKYPLIKLSKYSRNQPILLITSGFHGDEIAGPLTILNKLEDIVKMGEEKNVGLIIFPSINPSGFDLRQRYNIMAKETPRKNNKNKKLPAKEIPPNNDFLRYVKNHKLLDDLRNSKKYDGWVYSTDPNIVGKLPHETLRMHKQLEKMPIKNVRGHVDIHQDCFEDEILEYQPVGKFADKMWTYVYIFDKKPTYKKIIEKTENIVPTLRDSYIDTGYKQKAIINHKGYKEVDIVVNENEEVWSDKNGFIVRHDGTVTDLSYRLGVPYVVAIETSSQTPIEKAIDVNMIWIEEIINLTSKEKIRKRKDTNQDPSTSPQ